MKLFQGNGIKCMERLHDGNLASGSYTNNICIWDTNTGKLLHNLDGHTDSVRSMTQLSDGCLASYARDDTIRLWDLYHQALRKKVDHLLEKDVDAGRR